MNVFFSISEEDAFMQQIVWFSLVRFQHQLMRVLSFCQFSSSCSEDEESEASDAEEEKEEKEGGREMKTVEEQEVQVKREETWRRIRRTRTQHACQQYF